MMSQAIRPLARCAADPARSRRMVAEPSPANRSEFQRDRDRILHCTSFRRLALKTQVLMPEEGDHHRTRLTHSLEVAQIARSLARTLGFDEDLTEALALAHDLGHGPFGHTGEDALDRCFAAWGGFDHNVQSLRIVVDLEHRYFAFDGLNLTVDTLDGLAKRNGPVPSPMALLADYDRRLGLRLQRFASGEAQIASIADDIAYNAHDLEDGIRAGLLNLEEVAEVSIVHDLLRSLGANLDPADRTRMPFALARALVDVFARDVIAQTRVRLAEVAPADIEALRDLPIPIVALSPAFLAASQDLKRFLFARLYRHPHLVEMRVRASKVVADLAARFLADPSLLPQEWESRTLQPGCGEAETARHILDYLAGMTDRHALREHRRLFDDTPDFG